MVDSIESKSEVISLDDIKKLLGEPDKDNQGVTQEDKSEGISLDDIKKILGESQQEEQQAKDEKPEINKVPDSSSAQQVEQQYKDIPKLDNNGELIEEPGKPYQEPTLGEKLTGVGEAAATLLTGSTIGTAGYILGTAEALIQRALGNVSSHEEMQKIAEDFSSLYTYIPQTEEGIKLVKELDYLSSLIPPVIGHIAVNQPSGLAQGVSAVNHATNSVNAVNQAANAVRHSPGLVSDKVGKGIESLKQNRQVNKAIKANRNMGAAEVSLIEQRKSRGHNLEYPVDLSMGQLTKDLIIQRQEREGAKQQQGKKIRDHLNKQNEIMNDNYEHMIDETGTRLGDNASYDVGKLAFEALDNMAKKDKKIISEAYKKADNSPEAQEVVDLSALGEYLNKNSHSASEAPIMMQVQGELKRLEKANGDLNKEGDPLNIQPMTVKESEGIRKFINYWSNNSDRSYTPIVAREMKNIIDESTKGAGGAPYNRARRLRHNYGKKYDNKMLVRDLLSNKKGTDDRKIAFEKVTKKIFSDASSRDDIIHLRRLMNRTPEAKEALDEIRAQGLRDIKQSSISLTDKDPNGNPMILPSQLSKNIQKLDSSGKLEAIYGKKPAEMLRDFSDIAQDVYVSQVGAVNTSNTFTVLSAAIDFVNWNLFGFTAPLAIGARGVHGAYAMRKFQKFMKDSIDYGLKKDALDKKVAKDSSDGKKGLLTIEINKGNDSN